LRPEIPRATYYNASADLPRLSPFEEGLLARMRSYLAARGREPPELDAALCAVGREYTREALRGPERPSAAFIDFLMNHAGLTEPHPLVFHASFPVEGAPAFPLRFEEQLPRLLGSPATGVGLVSLRAGPKVGVTVVLLHRVSRLEALPQRASPGAVVPLRGRLTEGYRSPDLMVTTPSGAFRRQALESRNGQFEGKVHLDDGEGTYTIEVVASGPQGPTVVHLFPLYCGTSPPETFEMRTATVPTPGDERAAEALFVSLINEERARRGLKPLSSNPRLADVAKQHSLDMRQNGFVGHRSPRTGTLTDRLRQAGLPASVLLENIARNDTLDGAHHGLMNSPGHRRNILDPRVREVGVGVVFAANGTSRQLYVTQNFILPIAIVDPMRARDEIWSGAQAKRGQKGLPVLDRDETLDEVAALAARRLLAQGNIGSSAKQALISAELGRRGYPYRTLTAHLFIARAPEEPLDSPIWMRAGSWRAGVGVAQQLTSAFGDYALCVVLLLTEPDTSRPRPR
jgi:uncharacterized protein YkwD